jgi:hypothetical protein
MNPIGNPARMQSLLLANALAGKGYSPDTSKAILATPGVPKGASALQASAVPMQQQPAEQAMAAPEQEPQAPAGPQYDQDIARALMAPDFSPAPTSFSALARVLGAGIGTYQDTKNRQAESAGADYERQMLARTLAGLPPELQAYGKADPKGALALQAQAAMRPPEKPQAPREQTVAMPGGDFGNLQVRQQEQNGRWVDQAIMGREPEKPAGGPFAGTGMDAQALNIVAAYEQRKAQGQPTTPQDDYVYALARRELEQARVVGTPETGFTQVQPPPLPQYPGASGQAPQQPGTPQAQVQPLTPPAPKPATQDQTTAAAFANRIAEANQRLMEVDTLGADGWAAFLSRFPGGNYLQSPEWQKYDRDRRDFINAVLRRESGAAIGAAEFDSANQQYFPQPGDKPEVIEAKRRARELALSNMAQAAGAAYTPRAAQPAGAAVLRFDAQGNRLL